MLFRGASFLFTAIGIGGASVVCLPCGGSEALASALVVSAQAPALDTAIVRYRISGMTCSTCPVTARIALEKVPGVYRATVTIADSLGVVLYDPQRTAPRTIASELARLTGFRAAVIPDTARVRRGATSRR